MLIGGLPLALPLMIWSQKRLKRHAERRVSAQMEATDRILEFALGIAVLKAFRQTGRHFGLLERALSRSRRENIAIVTTVVPTGVGYAMCLELGFPLAAMMGGLSVSDGSMEPTSLLFGLVAALRLFLPLQQLVEFSGHLRIAEAAAKKFVRSSRRLPCRRRRRLGVRRILPFHSKM